MCNLHIVSCVISDLQRNDSRSVESNFRFSGSTRRRQGGPSDRTVQDQRKVNQRGGYRCTYVSAGQQWNQERRGRGVIARAPD